MEQELERKAEVSQMGPKRIVPNGGTVLITGGSRGIGKAIAEEFAKHSYHLVINYVSDKTDLEGLKAHFKGLGASDVLFVKTDVTNFESCENMVKMAVEKFGRVDALVNNAGITKDGLLMRMKEEDFEQVININLKGTFNVTRNVVPYMVKQKSGRIVNIASVVGVVGNAGQANYAASKAGIIGFTKTLAKELASRNILANAVAPGFIETDMTAILKEDVVKQMTAQIPMKKLGQVEDIAQTAVFLAKSQYITGQVIHVNGGMAM